MKTAAIIISILTAAVFAFAQQGIEVIERVPTGGGFRFERTYDTNRTPAQLALIGQFKMKIKKDTTYTVTNASGWQNLYAVPVSNAAPVDYWVIATVHAVTEGTNTVYFTLFLDGANLGDPDVGIAQGSGTNIVQRTLLEKTQTMAPAKYSFKVKARVSGGSATVYAVSNVAQSVLAVLPLQGELPE